MKIGNEGAGGLRPQLPPEKAGKAEKAGEASPATEASPEAPAEGPAEARGSAAMERLREVVGAVPSDTDAAAVDMVKGLLRAELGPEAAEQPGFDRLAESVAEKIKQDPMLGEKLRKVLGELARP